MSDENNYIHEHLYLYKGVIWTYLYVVKYLYKGLKWTTFEIITI